MSHLTWPIFVFVVEMGFHNVGQAGLKLLTSGDPPTLASQNAGISGVSHFAQVRFLNIKRGLCLYLDFGDCFFKTVGEYCI